MCSSVEATGVQYYPTLWNLSLNLEKNLERYNTVVDSD